MIKSNLFAAALIALTAVSTPDVAAAAAGYMTTTLEVKHRTSALELHVWYPTEHKGEPSMLGKNAVFTGIEVHPDAMPTNGEHPLVVLSHGSGGNAVNIGWIGAELADRGMVVVATNHPGTTSRDSFPRETIKVWERPADMSAIADHGEQHGFGSIRIDTKNIGAVGFSLGGHSVLSLAGARVNKQKYVEYCENYPSLMDCEWFAAGGVDFTRIEPKRFEQSNRDKRFKTVVAIDPALAQAYDHASLKDVAIAVKLINLGIGDEVPAAVNASTIAPHFGAADLISLSQATHFSFLGECTMAGAMIIKVAGEEPICSETGNRERADIHAELKKHIGGFLENQFSGE